MAALLPRLTGIESTKSRAEPFSICPTDLVAAELGNGDGQVAPKFSEYFGIGILSDSATAGRGSV